MHSNANISLEFIEGPGFASPYSRAWSDFLLVADYLCPVKSIYPASGCHVVAVSVRAGLSGTPGMER